MFVLLVVLMMADGSFKIPQALPVFATEEACKAVMEPLTDELKRQTGAEHILYDCTRVINVNNAGD